MNLLVRVSLGWSVDVSPSINTLAYWAKTFAVPLEKVYNIGTKGQDKTSLFWLQGMLWQSLSCSLDRIGILKISYEHLFSL
jgi:hypothetical protein